MAEKLLISSTDGELIYNMHCWIVSLDRPCDLGAIHTYASRMHALQRLGIQEEDLLEMMRYTMFRELGS